MKKLLSLLFLVFSIATKAQNIPQKPNPPRLVNDFAHILSSEQIERLERKLVNYDDSTSTQIVVVTVPTTGDYDIQTYALKILRDWGVGNAKTNNGIVILAAINDRNIRIETGYGMEGAVPDVIARQIIDNQISPNFRQGNYYQGFSDAAESIIKAAAGEYKAPEGYRKTKSSNSSRGGSILGFLIPVIIILIIISRSGGGGRGGGMISRRGSNPFRDALLGGILGSSIGRGGGGWSGGDGGGGWSGGGGGGGGGFGGFGGGSGGGGGASGSW